MSSPSKRKAQGAMTAPPRTDWYHQARNYRNRRQDFRSPFGEIRTRQCRL